jgi:hypothetical protein
VHDAPHEGNADQNRDNGQQQDGEDFIEQPPHIDGEGGGE